MKRYLLSLALMVIIASLFFSTTGPAAAMAVPFSGTRRPDAALKRIRFAWLI
jgi:hypothetical protein